MENAIFVMDWNQLKLLVLGLKGYHLVYKEFITDNIWAFQEIIMFLI